MVPDGVDDPARPSGGNVYDRRICAGLVEAGWRVRETTDPLGDVLPRLADGALVLVDGLLASAAPDTVAAEADRLRVAVLVHLPFGVNDPAARRAESTMLAAVSTVVVTSRWTRTWLADNYGLDRVQVVEPGVARAELATGRPGGGGLLCVGAIGSAKGQDRLVDALAAVTDLTWSCTLVGRLDNDPGFLQQLRTRIADQGLAGRVRLAGPLTGPGLDRAYAGADLLVSASRGETYGMVVTEALARGLPVIATDVGGVSEALDRTDAGLLVDDLDGLAAALRAWLEDRSLRDRLRAGARARRIGLRSWPEAARELADVLAGVNR